MDLVKRFEKCVSSYPVAVFMPTTACIIVQSRNVAPFGIGTKVETCNSNIIKFI